MATTDCAAIKSQLDAANAALTALQNGAAVRSITDSDGSRIEYQSTDIGKLMSRVALLQAQYDACLAGTGAVVTRPVNFYF